MYQIDKIMHARKKLTTAEKISHLLDMKRALLKKLDVINAGGHIQEFGFLSPQQFEAWQKRNQNPDVAEEPIATEQEARTSTIDEDDPEVILHSSSPQSTLTEIANSKSILGQKRTYAIAATLQKIDQADLIKKLHEIPKTSKKLNKRQLKQ